MGTVTEWIASRFKPKDGMIYIDDCDCIEATGEIYVRELALHTSISLIANIVSKCEFKTYSGKKSKKEEDWYLWNIEPNRNQNKFEFMYELVSKLLREKKCLVLDKDTGYGVGREMWIANGYTIEESSTTYDKFSNITTRGGKQWNNKFSGKDVFYFKMNDKKVDELLVGLETLYTKLFDAGIKGYKKASGSKYKFTYDSVPLPNTEDRKAFDALTTERLKTFLDAADAVVPIGKAYDLVEVSSGGRGASTSSSRDIRAMIDDIVQMTALAFGIPLQFFSASVDGMEGAYKQLMTNCITPICKLLETEINRKMYGFEGHKKGERIEVNTDGAIYHDMFEVATSIDKLIASSAMCVNDVLMHLGKPIIDEPWAWQHWITKNYSKSEDAMTAQGGDAG